MFGGWLVGLNRFFYTFAIMDQGELQEKKRELERNLSDPEVLRDARKVKEFSIELGKIGRELREQTPPSAASQKFVMEIRAGAGGEEAALFAAELWRMYSGYAKKRGWDANLIDSHPTALGGYKEIIFEIAGENAHSEMRNESGVHRIQRIPDTEKTGRIHTSTASVAVLPEAGESEVTVRPQDVKVEFYRSSGPGGQNVNKVETAVRITHLPTGLVVHSQQSRSQQKNREHAMMLLRTRLLDAQRRAEESKIARSRREQIGTAERAEKIRTYNFPQDRITDHRLKKSWHNMASILDGNLEPIVAEFKKVRHQKISP